MEETGRMLYKSDPEEMVIEIETERLRDFHDHPFKIREDQQMKSLMESIEKYHGCKSGIYHSLCHGVKSELNPAMKKQDMRKQVEYVR